MLECMAKRMLERKMIGGRQGGSGTIKVVKVNGGFRVTATTTMIILLLVSRGKIDFTENEYEYVHVYEMSSSPPTFACVCVCICLCVCVKDCKCISFCMGMCMCMHMCMHMCVRGGCRKHVVGRVCVWACNGTWKNCRNSLVQRLVR